MPWAGGVFTRTDGVKTGSTVWQQEQAANVGIISSGHDTHDQDIAGGINNCVAKDGSNTPTGDLPMGGYQHSNVAAAYQAGQYMEYAQVVAGYQPLAAPLTALSGYTLGAYAPTLLSFGSAEAAKAAVEVSQSITSSSTTLAIDMSQGWNVELTLDASVTTVTVSNWPATGTLGRLTLEITSTGAYTIAGWPGTTRWGGGVAPTLTASGRDTIVLTSADGGSTFRGYIAAQVMA